MSVTFASLSETRSVPVTLGFVPRFKVKWPKSIQIDAILLWEKRLMN